MKGSIQRGSRINSIILDTEERFQVECIEDKFEWSSEDRKKRVQEWAKAKTVPVTEGDRGNNGLYRPLVDKYEMRLLEIKPGKHSDQLKGALHHCSVEYELDKWKVIGGVVQRHALWMKDLTVPIRYTALSYTWGAPIFDAKFECDGHVKMITRSLESALRRFRQEDKAAVVWVDQICIDQGNNEEKAQQVPLMTKIYDNAVTTAIWLGESADDSDTAIQLLKDARVCLQFYTDQFIDPNETAGIGLPKPDSNAWEALWKLLSRPWFERLWIIQEVALSRSSWIVCGNSVIKWESFAIARSQLGDTGISQWLTQKFSTSEVPRSQRDVFKKALYLDSVLLEVGQCGLNPDLMNLLIDTRRAESTDPRDKVYGLLGITKPKEAHEIRVDYSDEYHATQLYQDILESHIMTEFSNNKRGILDKMLSAVDHNSVDLPSWVADWGKHRHTTSLGTVAYPYQADGRPRPLSLVAGAVAKIDSSNPAWKELQVAGLPFDTLQALSGVFASPDISPTSENKTLQMMLDFVTSSKSYPSPKTDFTAFWQTIVAGRDGRGKLACPDSFAEIFSYILDLTTGKKNSISGQTYTRRQGLPQGRGGLDEDKFKSRKPRSVGETFREARTAMIKATKHRRLGVTAGGHIGLFPEHSQVGDGVFVFMGYHAPCVLRVRVDEKYKFVGACYVHGNMGGEAVGPNPDLQDIILV